MICYNGNNHTKDEWCGYLNLDSNELNDLVYLLKRVEEGCHIPHSTAWCSAVSCPACCAEDLLKTREWWQPKP